MYYICIYIYMYYMWSYAHARKNRVSESEQIGKSKKNKMPGSAFPTADKKRKAPASPQGLKRSALYTIAARGCIGVKWREQCYNLRGVLLSRLGYNIARVGPDSYKAGAFGHF